METLRQEMQVENRRYIAKIELGRMISSIIDESNINEQSLNKEKQEALHLYRQETFQRSLDFVTSKQRLTKDCLY